MCLEIGLDTCQMKLYKIHLEPLPSWPVERHAVPCCRGTWRWWAILGFGALSNADKGSTHPLKHLSVTIRCKFTQL